MRIQLLLLSLTIAFASNLACQGAAGSHIETKYLIELPDAFVKTLNTDEAGKANLWHPRLTLTKVHSMHNATKTVVQEKKPAPAFASFLQMKQTDTSTDSLSLIPGGEDGTSVVKSSKMACDCRFVKDPNGMSFIQTDQMVSPVEGNDNQIQAATSFIEKEDKEMSALPEIKEKEDSENVSLVQEIAKPTENILEEKAAAVSSSSNAGDDDQIKLLLEKEERMKKLQQDLEAELEKEKAKKDQEKLMLEMLEKEEKSKQESADLEFAALLEKKKKLEELEAEEAAFREKMKKKQEEEELLRRLEKEQQQLNELKELEKMQEMENKINEERKIAMLLQEKERPRSYDDMLYHDDLDLFAELREKEEPRRNSYLRDNAGMPDTRYENNDNDLEGFYEFSQMYQKYQRYKSFLTEQETQQKNRRWDMDMGSSYGNANSNSNDRDLELLKKIKSVEDKSLREELIEALLNE